MPKELGTSHNQTRLEQQPTSSGKASRKQSPKKGLTNKATASPVKESYIVDIAENSVIIDPYLLEDMMKEIETPEKSRSSQRVQNRNIARCKNLDIRLVNPFFRQNDLFHNYSHNLFLNKHTKAPLLNRCLFFNCSYPVSYFSHYLKTYQLVILKLRPVLQLPTLLMAPLLFKVHKTV